MNKNTQKRKVNVYVDGFNIYHNIKNIWHKDEYKRLDLYSLCLQFITKDQELWEIFYFTAYTSRNKGKLEKQKKYIRALSHSSVKIILWSYRKVTRQFIDIMPILVFKLRFFLPKPIKDKLIPLKLKYQTYEEKKTDVNIAVKLVEDAFKNKFDDAIIISGDSDITPAIISIKNNFPKKKCIILLPVKAKWKNIQKVAHKALFIKEKNIKRSIFPNQIKISSKETIVKPTSWK